jgi:hypothetical protein
MIITVFEAWVAKARAVPIEEEIERRGISLRGKIDRCGPCPRCGGEDRFSNNVCEQCWNCRQCKTKQDKGDVIGFVQWYDCVDFVTAATTLAGEPPPKAKPNGHDQAEPKGIVVATFSYEDAAGNQEFVVERVEFQKPTARSLPPTMASGKKGSGGSAPTSARPVIGFGTSMVCQPCLTGCRS